jgi:hypothetical protein
MTTVASLRGYTTQARYYAANMAVEPDDSWTRAGWQSMSPYAPRPVFRLKDGRPVVIVNGSNHLTVNVCQVNADDIRATEDECFPPRD